MLRLGGIWRWTCFGDGVGGGVVWVGSFCFEGDGCSLHFLFGLEKNNPSYTYAFPETMETLHFVPVDAIEGREALP